MEDSEYPTANQVQRAIIDKMLRYMKAAHMTMEERLSILHFNMGNYGLTRDDFVREADGIFKAEQSRMVWKLLEKQQEAYLAIGGIDTEYVILVDDILQYCRDNGIEI